MFKWVNTARCFPIVFLRFIINSLATKPAAPAVHESNSESLAGLWLERLCPMLPKIRQGLVVAASGDHSVAELGRWQCDDADALVLLDFAQQVVNSTSDRYVSRDDKDYFALPLVGESEFVVVATEPLLNDTARASLARFLKAAEVWYKLLKQRTGPTSLGQYRDWLDCYPELASEFTANQPFSAGSTLLVSRLARLWQLSQVALLYRQHSTAPIEFLALSDTAKTWTATQAVQGLKDRAEALFAKSAGGEIPTGEGRVIESDQAMGLVASDGRGGQWLVLFDRPAQVPMADQWQALWVALVPLLALAKQSNPSALHRAKRGVAQLLASRWRWLAGLALLVLLVVPIQYRVSAPAELEGKTQRAVVAPEDGFVRNSYFRAGDTVQTGDLIAQLDDDELKLEHKKLRNQLADLERQYRQALVDSELSQSRVVKNQLAQAQAELDLVDHQLGRTQLIAPFSGVIITGDLTRAEGSPVDKGQVLFEIAPAGEFRLILQVDERNMAALDVGSQGFLYLNAQPSQGLAFTVVRVGSVAEQTNDGPQRYRLEAMLDAGPTSAAQQALKLQPGMQGVAKVEAGRRPLAWVLLHRPWHWLVLKWWAWAP